MLLLQKGITETNNSAKKIKQLILF